ncbi:MAG TPA: hypothetical protein VFR11_06620 [Micromonosporaceae bacterium]|nr:hypothetical protein [Micromonosporaceae bacterium]
MLYDVLPLTARGSAAVPDAITLEAGAAVISGAKAMLRATATTARYERAQIGTNYSDLGDAVVRQSLMGQTMRGSYVIPVLVPIPRPEQPDRHQDMIPHQDFHRATPEPFERRVVRTFIQSMAAIGELAAEPGRVLTTDELHELVYRGVSREFCMGLTNVLKQPSVHAFESNITWSKAIPGPITMPETVRIDADASDLVGRVAESLKQERVDSSSVFSGTIVQLRHVADDPFGEIAVSTMRRGRQSEVLVKLPLRIYEKAWDWHTDGRAVLVEGPIVRSPGRPLRVDDVMRCHPVDEIFLHDIV